MKTKINTVKNIIFVVILLLIGFFVYTSFLSDYTIVKKERVDKVTVDTMYVEKELKVPARSHSFENNKPEPKIVYEENPINTKLLNDYKSLKTDYEKLKKYEEAVTVREYDTTYVSKDSIISVRVKDIVTGTLDKQYVSVEVAEQYIKYREKVITKTIEKYPMFSIRGGVGFVVPTIPTRSPTLEAALGFSNHKGYNIDFGINLNQDIRVTLTKDIFVKYKK